MNEKDYLALMREEYEPLISIKKLTPSFDGLLVERYHERWCRTVDENDIHVIQSATGTGKTVAIIEAVNRWRRQGYHRFVYVCCRIALARDAKKRFAEAGLNFVNYKEIVDNKKLVSVDLLIISTESFHRIANYHFDV
jgi:superfamily II DNA or RNA helicase